MTERLRVDEPAPLLEFLAARLAGWSKNTIRQRLDLGCVLVNGSAVSRRDHGLSAGDTVTVLARDEGEARERERGARGLVVLHRDEELVAIDKPAGLLSVSTGRAGERTALALLRDALSTPRRPAALWPVHRLDRETSGVLLFARALAARDAVQERWGEARKTYLAVVEGAPQPAEGAIDAPLVEERELVRVGSGPGAKESRTRYRTLEVARGRALVEVELDTGRRQQIRAHLAHVGCPVLGDERRGSRGERLWLHAWKLEVPRPDGGVLRVEARPGREWDGWR